MKRYWIGAGFFLLGGVIGRLMRGAWWRTAAGLSAAGFLCVYYAVLHIFFADVGWPELGAFVIFFASFWGLAFVLTLFLAAWARSRGRQRPSEIHHAWKGSV